LIVFGIRVGLSRTDLVLVSGMSMAVVAREAGIRGHMLGGNVLYSRGVPMIIKSREFERPTAGVDIVVVSDDEL